MKRETPRDIETLARHIVRNAAYPTEIVPASNVVCAGLLALADVVPRSTTLVLGGSLARGEATFVPTPHGYELASDLDLLIVYESTLPPMSVKHFLAIARRSLPTTTIMMIPREAYERLGTTLGFEFKDLGIPLNQPALPAHTPVELDHRDAYELVLYCILAYFWLELPQRWADGDDSRDFHLELNRLCIKLLRGCGMLAGAYNHNDVSHMQPDIAALMSRELRWRCDPTSAPPHPGRFWPVMGAVLQQFDAAFGAVRPDAVTGTKYETRAGAGLVAYMHRLGHGVARRMLTNLGDTLPDREALITARQNAWAALVERGAVVPSHSPDEFFGLRSEVFRDSLLAMKVFRGAGRDRDPVRDGTLQPLDEESSEGPDALRPGGPRNELPDPPPR